MPGLGGCRARAPHDDFSRMQPDQPNPWFIVNLTFMKMISAAGEKEVELQGSSSVVCGNAAFDAQMGET